ncbi:low molecular weight phosphotyrosine protein phosphatase [Gordonia otitidis]|nr:low molecular weight phosphotyrosine protein phosphatase [Gordonia otitidis]UEA57836.1 low molecular weight phosphotyrosine protein phosphatase [Gordonia otitidis]
MDVLFVCTGNICRSPIAERICRDIAVDRGARVSATSAGVGALNGQPMHPFAIEVLAEHGCDATGFESRYLQPRILQSAELVLCLTREHRAACQRMVPARWKRMFTLIEFVELLNVLESDSTPGAGATLDSIMNSRGQIDTNSAHFDITDPMGRPKSDFERVYREVHPRVANVVEWAVSTAVQ